MAITIKECLRLAELARADPSLLSNHKGTVDRKLKEELAEITKVLDAFAGCSGEEEFIERLENEAAEIKEALKVYA